MPLKLKPTYSMEFVKKFLNSNYFVLLIFAVLAFVVFSTVMHGQFLYDDRVLIVENAYLRSLGNIPKYFVSNAARGANVLDTNLYRPLINIIHTFVFSFVQLETFVYHFLNVILHALNAFLVFLLFRKLEIAKVFALMAALVFVVHPIQAESVGYISGLPDILSTTFMLIGLNIFLLFGSEDEEVIKRNRRFWLIVGLLFLAFLSKELAVVFAPLLVAFSLYKWREYDGMTKEFIKKIIYTVFGMTAVYIVLKFTVLNFTGGSLSLGSDSDLYASSIWVRFVTFCRMLVEYMRLMFWPEHLYFEKPNVAYPFFGWQGLLGLVILFGGGVYAIVSYMKERAFMLGYLIFFIALFPVSGILIVANFKYADHWLYIPIIGVLFFLAYIFNKISGRVGRTIFVGCAIVVITLLGYRLYERNKQWADPVLFFENEIEYYPTARVYNHLGFEYFQTLQMKNALEYFNKAIELDDTYPQPHFHLGNFYYIGGDIEKSLDEFYAGLKIRPNHVATLGSISIIARQLGKYDTADEIDALYARIQQGDFYLKFEDLPSRERFSN